MMMVVSRGRCPGMRSLSRRWTSPAASRRSSPSPWRSSMTFSLDTQSARRWSMYVATSGGEGRIRSVQWNSHFGQETNLIIFKIAAQNCRKRKVEQIYSLEEDLNFARIKKKRILSERAELLRLQQEWRSRIAGLETSVLRSVGKSEVTWRLHADMTTGKVSIVNQSLSENFKPYPSLTV